MQFYTVSEGVFKVGLSSFKKNCFICFNESPLKMMKNVFYFILKALYVLKIFKFLSFQYTYWPISHEKKATKSWNLVREIFICKNRAEYKAGRLVSDLFLFYKKALYEVKASGTQLTFNIFR